MTSLTSLARIFIAISIAAFGVQQIVYGEFVTRLIPKLPAWIPWHAFWAYSTGVGLILIGVLIVIRRHDRTAALALATLGIASAVLLYPPQLAAALNNGGLWTQTGKALALSAAGFLIAASLRDDSANPAYVWISRLFLAAFFIFCGVEHFLYVQFVETLVPAWIPGHLFWTYFAGVALIAGGLGILVPRTVHLAAQLSSLMIFLWVILLHIPRALAAPRDSNETTAVFEALAISSACYLLAVTASKRGISPKVAAAHAGVAAR